MGKCGTYKDFVRFFELAFALPFYDKRFRRKLTQFLEQRGYGYTRNEIDRWANLPDIQPHTRICRKQIGLQ